MRILDWSIFSPHLWFKKMLYLPLRFGYKVHWLGNYMTLIVMLYHPSLLQATKHLTDKVKHLFKGGWGREGKNRKHKLTEAAKTSQKPKDAEVWIIHFFFWIFKLQTLVLINTMLKIKSVKLFVLNLCSKFFLFLFLYVKSTK